jgi:hypothetical protein
MEITIYRTQTNPLKSYRAKLEPNGRKKSNRMNQIQAKTESNPNEFQLQITKFLKPLIRRWSY